MYWYANRDLSNSYKTSNNDIEITIDSTTNRLPGGEGFGILNVKSMPDRGITNNDNANIILKLIFISEYRMLQ